MYSFSMVRSVEFRGGSRGKAGRKTDGLNRIFQGIFLVGKVFSARIIPSSTHNPPHLSNL
jgi:hypothetical protein